MNIAGGRIPNSAAFAISGALCASVVNNSHKTFTTETRSTLRTEDPKFRDPELATSSDRITAKFLMTEREYKSFAEFWPYYVSEHSKAATRALHAIGSTGGLILM